MNYNYNTLTTPFEVEVPYDESLVGQSGRLKFSRR